MGICFTFLCWKFVCPSTILWEATGLGFLEQKAPNFLLCLAERWDKVAMMGSHTLVYFVSLTEAMTENSRAICNTQLEYLKSVELTFGKKERKGVQSFLLSSWHGDSPACAWGDTSARIDYCRGLSGLRSLPVGIILCVRTIGQEGCIHTLLDEVYPPGNIPSNRDESGGCWLSGLYPFKQSLPSGRTHWARSLWGLLQKF